MFKAMIAFCSAALVAAQATAACVGTDTFQTCTDIQSGNSYMIQRFGNTTLLNGTNAQTGTAWSQQSYDFGNTTINQGIDKNGQPWTTTCTGSVCY